RDFQQADTEHLSRWKKWRRTSSKSLKKALSEIKGLSSHLVLWRHDIHSIEGKFGTGIQSYFSFLRFLVLLNFIIFILMFSFVTIPTIISKYGIFNSTIAYISPKNIDDICTIYEPSGNKGLVYFYTYLKDLLSGTGFLEVTSLFYGYYSINAEWISIVRYNLPLAYLLATFAYLALSFLWIIKRSVEGFKQNLVHDADPFQSYCNKVFAGWDFCITDPNAARLKHRSLQYELQTDLQEEKLKQKIAGRRMEEKLRIYSLRIFINIIVIAILLGCFYSIYRVTVFSQENSSVSIRNDTRTDWVKAGDYSKRNYCERVKYLNIAPFMQGSENAFFLNFFYSFLHPILSDPLGLARGGVSSGDVAEQSQGQCKWLSPLTLCKCVRSLWIKFLHKLGDTDLCQNVRQSCLSPSQPMHIKGGGSVVAGGVFENFIWMYIYIEVLVTVLLTFPLQIVLIHTRKPAGRPIRASSSNFFFLVVLLIGLLLAFIPLGVSIARIPSSKACGPFRNFNTSWEVIPDTILQFPTGLQQILFGMASEAFAVPVFVI
ncbi:TMC7 protein, partial [Horornis vulcanius]|nr:TMC7 protein [Horornis vulcanius]